MSQVTTYKKLIKDYDLIIDEYDSIIDEYDSIISEFKRVSTQIRSTFKDDDDENNNFVSSYATFSRLSCKLKKVHKKLDTLVFNHEKLSDQYDKKRKSAYESDSDHDSDESDSDHDSDRDISSHVRQLEEICEAQELREEMEAQVDEYKTKYIDVLDELNDLKKLHETTYENADEALLAELTQLRNKYSLAKEDLSMVRCQCGVLEMKISKIEAVINAR
jgi:hypothetical protein